MRTISLLFFTFFITSSCNNPLGDKSSGNSSFDNGHVAFPIQTSLTDFSISSAIAGDAQVTLSWQKSENATSYEVFYGTVSGSNTTNAPSCSGLSLSCVITGLTNTQQYFFIVKSSNGTESLDSTNELDATPISGDTAPVANNITPTGSNEDEEFLITLNYIDGQSDLATSCTLSSLLNISTTTACSCSAGVCTVGVTGTSNYSGSASFSYTVTANSLESNSAMSTFTINPINDSPEISNVSNQTIDEDKSTSALTVTINDEETSLDCSSSISMSSSNTGLVGNSDVVFAGTAPNCTATITPKTNQFGNSTITLTITDGSLTETDTFLLTVNSVFDPNELTGMKVWLDANDSSTLFQDSTCTTSTISNLDPVGCWKDKSGNSFNASSANPSFIPKLNTTDNTASIEFDGSNDHYDNDHNITSREVYIVYKMDSTLQSTGDLVQLWGQYTVGHVATDARNEGLWSFDGNVNQKARYSIDGKSLSSETGGSSEYVWSYNQFEIVRTVFSNDINITTQYIGIVDNFSIGTFHLGGQISEILVYSSELSTADAQKVEGYLACKWGLQSSLAVGHPYTSTCP